MAFTCFSLFFLRSLAFSWPSARQTLAIKALSTTSFLTQVVLVSTLLSLKSWESIFPAITRWRQALPIVVEMWLATNSTLQSVTDSVRLRLEGVLATLSLKLMLAFIPSILLPLGSAWPVRKLRAEERQEIFLEACGYFNDLYFDSSLRCRSRPGNFNCKRPTSPFF